MCFKDAVIKTKDLGMLVSDLPTELYSYPQKEVKIYWKYNKYIIENINKNDNKGHNEK